MKKQKTKSFVKEEGKKIKKEWKNILFNCIFALFAVGIPSLFYKNIFLTTTLLIIVSLIGLIKWKSSLATTIFIFGMFWGPISEMIAIHFGAWNYAIPNFYTVPAWLFLVWGMAAVFLFETSKEIHKLGVKDD